MTLIFLMTFDFKVVSSYPHLGQKVLFQGLMPRYLTRKSYMLGSFAINCCLVVGATLSGALASKKP